MITIPAPELFSQKLKPFKHQEETFLKSREMKHYALLWEMGAAKSKPIIDTATWLYLNQEIDGVLIISDSGAYRNWTDYELPIHMPDNIPTRCAHWASSMSAKETWTVNQLLVARDNVLDVLVMSVESFASDRAHIFAEAFLRGHYSMMVVDESTSIKNFESKRTKKILSLAPLAEYRRILTGTPIANNPMDLFSQFFFLCPSILGGSFVLFRAEYATLMLMDMGRGKKFYKIIGFRNIKKLHDSIAPHSSRVLKSECLDLPDKVYETRYVEHTPEQARMYSQLKSEALTMLDDGMITSTSALTALGKLHQINCGHIKLDDKTTVDIPSNRVLELLSILDNIPGKAIIWACFRRDIELICEALSKKYGPDSYVSFYGDTEMDDRPDNIRKFRTVDTCRWFVSNPATGGKGNTLVEATYAIYFSNSFHGERRWQSEDRIHRPGQKNVCTYVDLAVRGTVDVRIISSLKSKKDLASQVLDVFREMIS